MAPAIPKLFFLIPAFFIIVGAAVTASALYTHFLRLRAERWPVATATITSVREEPKGRGAWTVKTTYTYEVQGRQYEGSKIHPTYTASPNHQGHEAFMDALKPGRKVQVQYRPENPAQAFLATSFLSSSLISVAAGLLFLAFGTLSGVIMWCINFGSDDYASLIRAAL
jgi:hypothetical protein